MSVEITRRTDSGDGPDRDTLYMLGGVALVIFGAGLILSNPNIRKLLGQVGVGNLVSAAVPDIGRYFKLRDM
jgi:hypothetical protein